MSVILSSPYGIALFVAFDVLALLFAIAVTYRWLFKHFFDFLVSLICLIFTSPVWIYLCISRGSQVKKGERESVFDRENFVGKRGKEVCLLSFENSFAKYLPRLFDVFLGKLSFIGPTLKRMEQAETFSDDERCVFLVRPGLISPALSLNGDELDEEETLAVELKYTEKFGMFTDLKLFFVWLIKKIRNA